jgi:hypothetical protein
VHNKERAGSGRGPLRHVQTERADRLPAGGGADRAGGVLRLRVRSRRADGSTVQVKEEASNPENRRKLKEFGQHFMKER